MTQQTANASLTACPQCGAPVTLPEYADLALCAYCGSTLARPSLRREDLLKAAPTATPPAAPSISPTATPPDAPSAKPEVAQVLHSLSCPQCAGPLSVWAGRRILLCDHCGIRVLWRELDGVSRWCFPQSAGRLEAIGAAREWLKDYPGIAKRVRDAPIAKARLVVVPIWEHKALVAGWEFGTKLRTGYELIESENGNERLELEVREEDVREPRLQERRFFQAACDLDALGATRPRFSGRELLVPLVAGAFEEPATVLESQGDAAEMADQGRRIALRPATGAGDPRTELFILRESLTLLYYPLWIVEYRAGGRPHRIVVDGRDGRVNSATAPAARSERMVAAGGKAAALVVVAAFAVWLASVWSEVRVPMAFAAAIVVIAAVYVLARPPAREKVEYHEPFSS